jgi:hypothetical protein
MRQISQAEAVRELTSWNKSSLLGCTFSRADAAVVFRVSRAKLELRTPTLFFLDGRGQAMLHIGADASFTLREREELAVEEKRLGFKCDFETSLQIKFVNHDSCFIYEEKSSVPSQ